MNSVVRRWYDLGLAVAAVTLTWLLLGHPNTLQVILALNLIVLVWHQLEEMRWPGSSPWILNEVFNARGGPADRYPLNQVNCAVINIGAWALYAAAIAFPQAIWLGLAQVVFGPAGQLVIHAIIINRRLGTWYNPGLAAVVLGHVPLGLWYLAEVYGRHLITGWDWVFAALTLGIFTGGFMRSFAYTLLASRQTRHPFEPQEMNRWDRTGHLNRAGIKPLS